MKTSIICAQHLSKVYKLYWGPRALVQEILFRIPSHHQLTALKDVTFEVEPGEAFGVVGDNGAGKSTLLKILTGTTFPSSGTLEIQGQVSALLELGTGFHPEFTGRENIYFSGALMGLGRREIAARETDIIRFSELEDFIDKPVKTYSSGMYVRLGFAVATGFESNIVVIDEALAVGDQSFQKKCTDRILDFRERGKTILFCSHNLHQVKALCGRAIWLHRGEVRALGPASEVVGRYNDYCRGGENNAEGADSSPLPAGRERHKPLVCWIERVRLRGRVAPAPVQFKTGDTLWLDIWARFSPQFRGEPGIGVALLRNDGVHVYTAASSIDRIKLRQTAPGCYTTSIVFPNLALLSGRFSFNVITTDQNSLQAYDIWENVEPFLVTQTGAETGVARLEHRWETGGPAWESACQK
ncbi:MAG: ABC transporter ATP-binding protein [Acidobacteriota bacterium]